MPQVVTINHVDDVYDEVEHVKSRSYPSDADLSHGDVRHGADRSTALTTNATERRHCYACNSFRPIEGGQVRIDSDGRKPLAMRPVRQVPACVRR
jgi:hypothetical protein